MYIPIISNHILVYDWITIMGYRKHELKNKIHVVPPQTKFVILHHYLPITATSPQHPLFSFPKVAVVERFDCSSNLINRDLSHHSN